MTIALLRGACHRDPLAIPSATASGLPPRPETTTSRSPCAMVSKYSLHVSTSDHNLRDGQEFLIGNRPLVAAALRHRRRADAAGERHHWRRQFQAGGEAAQREVASPQPIVSTTLVLSVGRANRSSATTHHHTVRAVGDRQFLATEQRRHPVDQVRQALSLFVQAELGFGAIQAVVVGATYFVGRL